MPVKVTQDQFIQRWQAGTQAGQGRYTQGVQQSADWAGPTVAALPTMLSGFQEAMSSGRIEAGINRIGTAGWRNATVAKAGNWLQGVTSPVGVQNMRAGAGRLYNMLNTAMQQVDQLPRGSLAQNLARANALATSMYNQKRGI